MCYSLRCHRYVLSYFKDENLCKEKGCEQICEVIKREAVCDCQLGFQLDENGTNCTGQYYDQHF